MLPEDEAPDPSGQYKRIDNLDAPIYRVFGYNRFEEMIGSKTLTLVHPSKWDDPFENFFLKGFAVDNQGNRVSMSNIHKDWYGQCWTFHKNSDAMWRIYSPGKNGVRVRTTPRKLLSTVYDPKDAFANLKSFLGKVVYKEESDIIEIVRNRTFWDLAIGGQNDKFAETLLIKRLEFSHENEIRILFADVNRENPKSKEGFREFPINPDELIEEATVDPRLSSIKADEMIGKIKALGFTGTINQSDLYKINLPPIKLE